MSDKRTAIITGTQQGIGAGLVEGLLKAGYNVVATSLHATASLTPSPSQILVDGDIGKQETAAKAVEAAIKHFGTIDVLVNNAGIFRIKPFTDFTHMPGEQALSLSAVASKAGELHRVQRSWERLSLKCNGVCEAVTLRCKGCLNR
jgi:NAD(P)-dependent dehydrogenase (short-subunit alcohol dehydrogenase family)